MSAKHEFDVLLSFAGQEREYARAIYDIGNANGLRVFLDEEFQHEIWGQNLVEYLNETYRNRGRFVVALISAAYRDRAYARVERRAALDRMVEQAGEYLLPVKTDDAWIDGLPKATAYLDLRIHGVIGVCEHLVRKILGMDAGHGLTIPPETRIPRIPMGCIPAEQLSKYLLELCSRSSVAAFGAIIYDERNAEIRKLLIDPVYWDALDKASGPSLEVFALRDIEAYAPGPVSLDLMTMASMGRSRDRGYYFSKLLKEYFGKDKTRLRYPSLLLFIAEARRVERCWLIPLRVGSQVEAFSRLERLFSTIANGITKAGGPTATSHAIGTHLQECLLGANYSVYSMKSPGDTRSAVDKLMSYVER